MFATIEKNKHCKEFGLYRYDSQNDCYSQKKKTAFSFHYFIVLLTCVIILLSICAVTYNYINEPDSSKKIEINSTKIFDTSTNLDYEEPIALELNKQRRDDPRPFLYEIRDPQPVGFSFPQENDQNTESQNLKPIKYKGKNIQEIIKLLEQDDKKIKKPKRKTYLQDPFFPFKPQNPSDINLLAVNNFRFAPSVQNEVTRLPDYPKYEIPNLDYPKRQKQQPLYNQNNYFNHITKFHQNRIQPYWNRPHLNNQNFNRKKNAAQTQPMIVHFNLYPKKKKKHNDQRLSESSLHQNCTDSENGFQINNTTQFNQMLEHVHNSFQNNNENILHFKFKLNNDNKINDFKYLPTQNPQENSVDIQKSISFSIINSNTSEWKPMFVDSNHDNGFVDNVHNHGNTNKHAQLLEVGEANEVAEDDSVTLPTEVFQKYFNTKPTQKFSDDWDWEKLRENPNLVNHRPKFEDRNEKK